MACMTEELSVKEAAELTGYSEDHVYHLAQTGRIKARKVLTVWQIDKDDLLAYLARMEEDPRGGPRRRSEKAT